MIDIIKKINSNIHNRFMDDWSTRLGHGSVMVSERGVSLADT